MAVNNGSNDTWQDRGDNGAAAAGNQNDNTSSQLTGLFSLLTQTSSTFTGRNIPEMNIVYEELGKIFKARKENGLDTQKTSIVPEVDVINPNVSPILPGLVLWLKRGNVIYMAPFLFYTSKMITDVEEVTTYSNVGHQRVNVPKVPASYINKQLNVELTNMFVNNNGAGTVVIQLAASEFNLELYSDAKDVKEVVARIVNCIDREWETGIFVKLTDELANTAGQSIPSPFYNGKPYGSTGTADARILPIQTPLTGDNGVIMPSNMEVSVVTTNTQGFGQNVQGIDATPREVCRTQANVTLLPVSHQEYIAAAQRNGRNIMGLGGPLNDGWKPLRPAIMLNNAQAGAQMNSNGGIIPFFMGLYSLMCANNKHAYSEVIRRPQCGVRGSLLNIEPRLDKLFHENGVQRVAGGNSIRLDNKTANDMDIMSEWIRRHVMQSAIFTIPFFAAGANSALTKLLQDLRNPKTQARAMKTVVAAIDALSNNAFSNNIAANIKNNVKSWNTTMPLYHQSAMIVIDGTARFEGQLFNLGEIDEVSAARFAGPNGQPVAERLMRNIYMPIGQETLKSRQQAIRVILSESMNLTDVHINDFGRVGIMDPGFMHLLGTTLASIGTLGTSSINGSYSNNEAVFAPGTALAVDYVAGSNSFNGSNQWDTYGVV